MFGDLFLWGMHLFAVVLFVFIIVLGAAFFVQGIMRSVGYLRTLTMRELVLWSLGTSFFVIVFEFLGRFFLISINLEMHYATHIVGILLLHVVYFIISGLAVRAVLMHRHQSHIQTHDAVIFLACVGICFYFLLGSIAGMITRMTQKLPIAATCFIVK